jgi:hypothetical protein
VQVAVDGPVARLVGGDVARLLDRQRGMRARRGGHSAANALDVELPRQLGDDHGGAPVSRELGLRPEAERAEAPLDFADRRPRHGRTRRVEVRELARRPPEFVAVHDRVAARRLADGAVVERLGAADRAEREARCDEAEPGDDR